MTVLELEIESPVGLYNSRLFPSRIVSDKVVSEVVIRTAAGIVTSIITTGSVERMNLKEGDNVFAVMKATSVSVEKGIVVRSGA